MEVCRLRPRRVGLNHSRAAAICLLGGSGWVSPPVRPSPVSRLTCHPRLAPRLASPQPRRTVPPHRRVGMPLELALSLRDASNHFESRAPDVLQLTPCPSLVTRRTCRTGYAFPGPSSTLRTAQPSHRSVLPVQPPPSRASDRPFTRPVGCPSESSVISPWSASVKPDVIGRCMPLTELRCS